MLAVKDNQRQLHEEVKDIFDCAHRTSFEDVGHDCHQTVNKGHGRIETRECWSISDPTQLAYIQTRSQWKNLTSVVMVRSERDLGDQVSLESRYYISTLEGDAKQLLDAVRAHWSIENSLRWVLDVSFKEDESRVRTGNAPQNMSILRHMALNMLKADSSINASIKGKRKRAGWNNDYLLKILSN